MIRSFLLITLILFNGCVTDSSWRYDSAAKELEEIELNDTYLYGIDWLPISSSLESPNDQERIQSKQDFRSCIVELNSQNEESSTSFPAPKSKVFGVIKIVNCMNNKNWKPKVSELYFLN